jgi:hypothetical protein
MEIRARTAQRLSSRASLVAAALVLVVASGIPPLARAQSPPTLKLDVKPLLCITDRVTPACKMSFLLQWSSTSAGNYCAHNDFAPEALRCWNNTTAGEFTEQREVTRDFSYWMRDTGAPDRLAVARVQVLQLDGGERKRQRRSRHVWDIL